MRNEGDRLIVELAPRRSLLEILATLESLDDDFAEIKENWLR